MANAPASKYRNHKAFLTSSYEIIKAEDAKGRTDGTYFDSKLEAEYFRDVVVPGIRQGKIIDVKLQPKFILLDKQVEKGHQAMTYSPDFVVFYEDGTIEAVDVKGGFLNERFPLKQKMFDFLYPFLNLVVMKKANKYGGWITAEKYAEEKRKEKKANKADVRRKSG